MIPSDLFTPSLIFQIDPKSGMFCQQSWRALYISMQNQHHV